MSDLPHGFPDPALPERIGPPAALDEAQRAAADELINGPRRGVYGPFRPLLHKPSLLRAFGRTGEVLRFEGALEARLREWTICVVARETTNVFEWRMHLPLAAKEGVPNEALQALETDSDLPADAPSDLKLARSLARELLRRNQLDEGTYAQAVERWGEAGLVEMVALIGYFAAVCWLMNVARTPGPAAG
jgi:4-carboxymuconolactone decarboxylase